MCGIFNKQVAEDEISSAKFPGCLGCKHEATYAKEQNKRAVTNAPLVYFVSCTPGVGVLADLF